MLPKKYRLPSYLIPQVLKKGKRFHSKLFTLIVDSASPPSSGIANFSSRFAIIVPIKINKRSTKRNRIKRQLHEIIRLNLKKIKVGYNVILLAKRPIINENFASIKAEVEKLLKKAKLM